MIRRALLLICLPCALWGASRQNLLDDLHFVKSLFEVKYAPLQWKKEYTGFNLDQEIGKAACSIEASSSLRNYHRTLKKFCNATKDYHVGVHFYATEEASLPFQVKSAAGRYFFVHIDRSALPFSKFPFSVGDEILGFDGKPIDQAVEQIKLEEFGDNSKETDQALAEMALTCRRASNGDLVPSGFVEVLGLKKGEKHPRAVTLQWSYYPERVQEIHPVVRAEPNYAAWRLNPRETVKTERFFDKRMIYGGWTGSHVGDALAENKHGLGARSSFVPSLGKRVWTAKKDAIFDSYIFNSKGHNIAYIRIPHYMGDEEEMKEFCETMQLFQRNTDALVIDQLNNPGGSIFYVYALIAALTDENRVVPAPKHRLMLTQEEVYMAISILDALEGVKAVKEAKEVIGDTLGGYPVSMETVSLMRGFCNFVLDQWSKGQVFTEPTHLFGVDKIYSHPNGVYKKPILLLTNALDFSSGDFFPATLQDAGRVKILGTRTAGAGGFVLSTSYPNRTAVAEINLTGSIAERITESRAPIENLGVQPDIQYDLSVVDLQNNYCEYADKIVETVLSMI